MRAPAIVFLSGMALGSILAAAAPTNNNAWSDYLIPLPHEIAVSGTVAVSPNQVGIVAAANASAMVTQAVAGLRASYHDRSACYPDGTAFVIIAGKLSAKGMLNGKVIDGAERLKQVPSASQAYVIRPMGSNALAVAGLDDKGVFYGIQTLSRLLTAKLTTNEAVIPVAVVTDWPDMDERGTWNTGWATPGFIPWMASLKLNIIHGCAGGILFRKDAPAVCMPLPMDAIRQAGQYAFHLVPHVTHYDYWPLSGGFSNFFPELVGKGDSAVNPMAKRNPNQPNRSFSKCRCPCASNPKFTGLVTDWVRSAADQGLRDACLWLSEFSPCQCECKNCMKNGPQQFQMETRASIDALQAVQKQYPDLVGRITFCLRGGTNDVQASAECLAMLPGTGIKAEKHYWSNKAFEDYAANGNWLATYDGPFLVSMKGLFRFGCATPMLDNIRYYSGKHYSGLYCLGSSAMPPNIAGHYQKAFADYQLHALAEWTWNNKGRDLKAFARAWATRQNIQNPDQFAAWIEICEPLEIKAADLHGSAAAIWDKSLTALSADQPLPDQFPKPELLTDWLAACERAIPVARACGDQSIVEETMLLRSYFLSFAQLAGLHKRFLQKAAGQPVDNAGLEQAVREIKDTLDASARHHEKLMSLIGVDPKTGPETAIAGFNQHIKTVTGRLDAVSLELCRRK